MTTWRICKYCFPNRYQVLRDNEPVLSGVSLGDCYRYVTNEMADADTLHFDGSTWTGAEWRSIWVQP